MELIYPVLVIYCKGAFVASVPSVGNYTKFAQEYIEANEMDVNECEVFAYNRKDWISMLMASKDPATQMIIEKERVILNKTEMVEGMADILVDWAKEDGLEEFYSQEEIEQIEENKTELVKYNALTEEVLAALPHQIEKKYRTSIVLQPLTGVEQELTGLPVDLSVVVEDEGAVD